VRRRCFVITRKGFRNQFIGKSTQPDAAAGRRPGQGAGSAFFDLHPVKRTGSRGVAPERDETAPSFGQRERQRRHRLRDRLVGQHGMERSERDSEGDGQNVRRSDGRG